MVVLDFSKMTTLFGDVLRFLGRLKRSGLVKHFWDMTIWPSSVWCFLFCLFWKLQWQTGYLLCGMSLFPHILKLKFYMVYKWSPHHCLLTLPHSRKKKQNKKEDKAIHSIQKIHNEKCQCLYTEPDFRVKSTQDSTKVNIQWGPVMFYQGKQGRSACPLKFKNI